MNGPIIDGTREKPKETGSPSAIQTAVRWLDRWEDVAFVIVAVFLLFAAMAMLGYSVVTVRAFSMEAIFIFVHDLLFVMIILEILGTVLAYLKDRRISIRPFLFIGIIFAIRKILMVGAKLSAGGEPGHDLFVREMTEMSVGAVIVLILVVAYYILAKTQMTDEDCIGCLGRRRAK